MGLVMKLRDEGVEYLIKLGVSNFDKRRAYAVKSLLLGGDIPAEVSSTKAISMTQLEGLETQAVGESFCGSIPDGDSNQVLSMSQTSCPDFRDVVNSTMEGGC